MKDKSIYDIIMAGYTKAKKILKVDHHPCKVEIASHPILDTESAAAAEIMTDILLKWKGTTLSKEAASYLYIGIVGDSRRFQYSSTNAATHTSRANTARQTTQGEGDEQGKAPSPCAS